MKNTDIESMFESALSPVIKAAQDNIKCADKLCDKIEKSNGQIYRAFMGMTSNGFSAIPLAYGVKNDS